MIYLISEELCSIKNSSNKTKSEELSQPNKSRGAKVIMRIVKDNPLNAPRYQRVEINNEKDKRENHMIEEQSEKQYLENKVCKDNARSLIIVELKKR